MVRLLASKLTVLVALLSTWIVAEFVIIANQM
jgi:hypothetical protein